MLYNKNTMIASKKLFSITYAIFMIGTIVLAMVFLPAKSNAAWTCIPNYSLIDPFRDCVETSVEDVIGTEELTNIVQEPANSELAATSANTLSNQQRIKFLLKIAPILEKMFR